MVINDAGLTPLQMARSRGHVSVVRLLEEYLCLFSGIIREISGLGILETIAPNLVTKKVWVVVLPVESGSSRRPTMYELAVYQSIKVPQPRTAILLSKAEIEEPKFNIPDPVLYITDKTNKTKYKFLSEHEGDKAQLEKLYKACKGISQTTPAAANSPSGGRQDTSIAPPLRQPVLQSQTTDASRPANQMGGGAPDSFSGWGAKDEGFKGWGPSTSGGKSTEKQPVKTSSGGKSTEKQPLKTSSGGKSTEKQALKSSGGGGWDAEQSSYNGWGPGEAGPSALHSNPVEQPTSEASFAQPSAPPLPEESLVYPSLNMSANLTDMATDEKSGGTCVICWDAPAEGACVPCGHLAGCMECLSEIKAKNWGCPVCRVQIQQIVKVYAV
ncbi:hypothetical protein L7F22_022324 [Adiantum nelumboides]|nr:hypothetical protein [Adiantum nelumboides]